MNQHTDVSPIHDDTKIVKTDTHISTEIDGQLIAMDIESAQYFEADEIGTDILRRLDSATRVAELCASLAADYDGSEGTIRADTIVFLMAARDAGLVTWA